MKKILLFSFGICFAFITALQTTSAGYYSHGYYHSHNTSSCSSYATDYVCGVDGNDTKTFKNHCYLNRDRDYRYLYSGRCTTLKTRNYGYGNNYYSNSNYNNYSNYGYDHRYYSGNTYRYYSSPNYYNHTYGTYTYKRNTSDSDNINYSYNDRVNYNNSRYYNHYSPNHTLYRSYFSNSNTHSCPTYNMRQLVPQCYYKYATDNRGCTRPVIHCSGSVREKFVDNRSYSFTSYGVTQDQYKCPVYKLSAAVNGCSYEYVKNSDGCDIPRLVCGTANTTLSGNLKLKADRELAEKYQEIENTYLDKNSKIVALKNLKRKFEATLVTDSSNGVLLRYMIASIDEKIEYYQLSDGVTPVFDLLD